ncbi:MAG: GMC family oxidoreductase [Proteobacteria bacterium]|nr:GMC family oxidoreductase [Pseudomonadota bacterium]
MKMECDVLIIGSGAGGACVADVLTRAGLDVLMIEEGPELKAGETLSTAHEALPRLWRAGGLTMALGPTPISYAEGRCLGGGTEINSGIFQRTPAELLEAWAKKYRIVDFNAHSLAPYYDRATTAVKVSEGTDDFAEDSGILRRGGEAMGWKVSTLDQAQLSVNGPHGGSLAYVSQKKLSAKNALLPAAKTRGLRILSGCRALRLETKGKHVTRVHVMHGKTREAIQVKHVFLCAGAIYTPFLLRQSGFRAAQIGSSLRMHPTIKCLAFFNREVNAQQSRLPLCAVTQFMPDQRLGGSVFMPAFYGMALAESWEARGMHLFDMKNAAMYYAMARAEGRGSVHALPFLPDPVVRYRLTPEDRANLAMSAGRLAQALFAAGAKKVYPSLRGHTGWSDPAQARHFGERGLQEGQAHLMSVHLFSSCPPGENAAITATSSYGQLRGASNVTIADASQIPEAPGVNPQATVMALAFRNAEHFLQTRKKAA